MRKLHAPEDKRRYVFEHDEARVAAEDLQCFRIVLMRVRTSGKIPTVRDATVLIGLAGRESHVKNNVAKPLPQSGRRLMARM